MKTIALVILVSLVGACSSETPVPSDSYGILFRLGKVKSTVTGPSALRARIFLEKVVIVQIHHETLLSHHNMAVRFKVTDPIQYYIATGGTLNMDSIFESQLLMLKKKGESQSMKNLENGINKLGLPIQFESESLQASGNVQDGD